MHEKKKRKKKENITRIREYDGKDSQAIDKLKYEN